MRSRALLIGALSAATLVPGSASAAVKTVFMGTPPSAGKQFQKLDGDANAFFPASITVRVGQPVKFLPVGFHTLDIPAKGSVPYPLLDANSDVQGANDAAGNPFWFNGQAALAFNAVLFNFTFGKTLTYNGTKTVESGLPVQNKPKPVTVKFAKAGTVTYYCDVHPGMKATVHVVAKSAKAPSVKSDAKAVADQVSRDLKTLKRIGAFKPGSGTIQIGNGGSHGVESYDFFPAKATVKVGTTVTFKMPAVSTEIHTATTGPGDPEKEPDSYLGQIAASFQGPAPSPLAVYPSDQPGGTPASLTSTLHGNGFWNTGVLNSLAGDNTPQSNVVTFAQAGTYTFHCMIHPFMTGTVTVTS